VSDSALSGAATATGSGSGSSEATGSGSAGATGAGLGAAAVVVEYLYGAILVLLLFVSPHYVRPLRFRRGGAWARSLAWSCAADLADAAVLGLCLRAVGADLGPGPLLAVLLAINVAILVPSTPGHVGVMEAAALAALLALGVPPERALAGAVLYHGVQIVPGTALGLLSLRVRPAVDLA